MTRKAEQADVDLPRDVLNERGMAPARNELLHKHEEEIATHLKEKVYTDAHFSILRLVGCISKRVAGLCHRAVDQVGTQHRRQQDQAEAAPA